MPQLDALGMTEDIRHRLVELAVSENFFRDPEWSSKCREIWSSGPGEGGLVGELWVEGAFPSKLSGEALEDVAGNLIPSELVDLLDTQQAVPRNRKLYTHQVEALAKTMPLEDGTKPAVIVSSGTGSGKTEAFLLPLLREIWKSKRSSSGQKGVRCIILYPMNALVADQVDRLYDWLKPQEGEDPITVFHFTSETPDNRRLANSIGEPYWSRCRMRTRQEARGLETHGYAPDREGSDIPPDRRTPPPDILITNYSMLEYMLCRPQDQVFFGDDLECIVLDEAHLYTGTLAAEITLLLRRILSRCGVSPQDVLHIATSATLGGSKDDLRDFASKIFSKSAEATYVIYGEKAPVSFNEDIDESPLPGEVVSQLSAIHDYPLHTLDDENRLIERGTTAAESVAFLAQHLPCIAEHSIVEDASKSHDQCPARFLHEVLRSSPVAKRLAKLLYERKYPIISVSELAHELTESKEINGNPTQAAILLLRLCACGRTNSEASPLIPHRLHLLAKGPEGLSVSLLDSRRGPDSLRVSGLGYVQPLATFCKYSDSKRILSLPVYRCNTCGEIALGAELDPSGADCIDPVPFQRNDNRKFFVWHHHESTIGPVCVDPYSGDLVSASDEHVKLYLVGSQVGHKEDEEEAPSIEEAESQSCPNCGAAWSESTRGGYRGIRPVVSGDAVFISVLTETVLHSNPPMVGEDSNIKPANGRRLLCFSDSRREAARLGPILTIQHETMLIRAAIAKCAAEQSARTPLMDFKTRQLAEIDEQLASSSLDMTTRFMYEDERKKLQADISSWMEGLPYPQFCQLVNRQEQASQILERHRGETHELHKPRQPHDYCANDWEENIKAVSKCIEAIVALEFQAPSRTTTNVESMGLVEVAYPGLSSLEPPAELLGLIPSPIAAVLSEEMVWPDLLAALLDTTRVNSATAWSDSSQNADRQWLDEDPLKGAWITLERSGTGASRFWGDPKQKRPSLRNRFIRNLLQSQCPKLGKEETDQCAEKILKAAFEQFAVNAGLGDGLGDLRWLRRKDDFTVRGQQGKVQAIQIALDRLSIRVPKSLYLCPTTSTLWPRSVLGWAPIAGCRGDLEEINQVKADSIPRWGRRRTELKQSELFREGLWAEEHSAQLDPRENRRLQNLFKAGIRNILSCTTTMELGIDIGGLHSVLLGNVAPGLSNHLQRAGRAGRRSDGSAMVVSYARNRPYDREVFRRFDTFLRTPLRVPNVFLEREKIVLRHINAALFAYAYQGISHEYPELRPDKTGAMDAFGKVGALSGRRPLPYWRDASKPQRSPNGTDYSDAIVEFLRGIQEGGSPIRSEIQWMLSGTSESIRELADEDTKWSNYIEQLSARLSKSFGDWKRQFDQLVVAWDELSDSTSSKSTGNAYYFQTLERWQTYVIKMLADESILPRYGFPINLHRLNVHYSRQQKEEKSSKKEDVFSLERQSVLALSEYVPGSQVLVGGRYVVPRGLLKTWVSDDTEGMRQTLALNKLLLETEDGHVYEATSKDESHPLTGKSPVPSKTKWLLFPTNGYTTAAWDPPKLKRIDLDRVGDVNLVPVDNIEPTMESHEAVSKNLIMQEFGGLHGVTASFREECRIIITNSGRKRLGFAVCTRCGYTDSEIKSVNKPSSNDRRNLPRGFEFHAPTFSKKEKVTCWRKNEPAPVLRYKVLAADECTDMILIDFDKVRPGSKEDEFGLLSLGHALVIAGTQLLQLDSRELGTQLKFQLNDRFGIVIYDNNLGGAGHCMELLGRGVEWFGRATEVLVGTPEHDSSCEAACLDCILDFASLRHGDKLDRNLALDILRRYGTDDHEA